MLNRIFSKQDQEEALEKLRRDFQPKKLPIQDHSIVLKTARGSKSGVATLLNNATSEENAEENDINKQKIPPLNSSAAPAITTEPSQELVPQISETPAPEIPTNSLEAPKPIARNPSVSSIGSIDPHIIASCTIL